VYYLNHLPLELKHKISGISKHDAENLRLVNDVLDLDALFLA
jgi:hypothetical protein